MSEGRPGYPINEARDPNPHVEQFESLNGTTYEAVIGHCVLGFYKTHAEARERAEKEAAEDHPEMEGHA